LSQTVLPWDAISDISDQTGIPTQTLADWNKHRMNPETPHWAPLVAGHSMNRELHAERDLEAKSPPVQGKRIDACLTSSCLCRGNQNGSGIVHAESK
jgi:hypothetical protein